MTISVSQAFNNPGQVYCCYDAMDSRVVSDRIPKLKENENIQYEHLGNSVANQPQWRTAFFQEKREIESLSFSALRLRCWEFISVHFMIH